MPLLSLPLDGPADARSHVYFVKTNELYEEEDDDADTEKHSAERPDAPLWLLLALLALLVLFTLLLWGPTLTYLLNLLAT